MDVYNFIPEDYEFPDSYIAMRIMTHELPTSQYYEKIEKVLKSFSEYKIPENLEGILKDVLVNTTDGVVAGAGLLLDGLEELVTSDESMSEIAKQKILEVLKKSAEIYSSIQASEGGILPNETSRKDNCFYLPLPSNLSSLLSHNYDTDELDPKNLLLKSTGFIAAALGAVPSSNKNDSKGVAVAKSMANFGSKLADNAKNAVDFIATQAKRQNATLDTNPVTIYKGTKLRTFSFPVHIVPYSEEHANNIFKGILALKSVMSGTKGASAMTIHQGLCFSVSFFNIPSYVRAGSEIYYNSKNEEIERLIGLNENIFLNLTDININYGADGALMMYSNGMPKSITITLNFTERIPMYLLDEKDKK